MGRLKGRRGGGATREPVSMPELSERAPHQTQGRTEGTGASEARLDGQDGCVADLAHVLELVEGRVIGLSERKRPKASSKSRGQTTISELLKPHSDAGSTHRHRFVCGCVGERKARRAVGRGEMALSSRSPARARKNLGLRTTRQDLLPLHRRLARSRQPDPN